MSQGGSNPKPAFAIPAIVLGTAAAAGTNPQTIRSDSTIAAFDATAPVTQAFGDAAAVGSAAVAARRDHKHGMPSIVLADLPTITQRAQALGSTGGPTTNSGTPVALADPAVTLTTAGGDLLVWWHGGFSNGTANAFVSVQLYLDGSPVGVVCSWQCVTAFAVYQFSGCALMTGVSAASHTLQLYWFTSGGSTGTANGTNRSLAVLELRK